LLAVLNQFQSLFDGTLGYWKKEYYDIALHPDAMQNHTMHALIKVHEATLNMELERLCKVGVLRKINRYTWGSPAFIIPKKDGIVLFPRYKLEGFQYATSLDLNMGYYHIELSPHAKCTIVLPWGKYEYKSCQWAYVIAQTYFKTRSLV
jgi:hypothetical protein